MKKIHAYFLCLLCTLFSYSVMSAPSLSPRTYNSLMEIQSKIDETLTNETVKELDQELKEMAEDLSGSSLGLALTLQTHAQLMVKLERPNDAIRLLKKAVAIEDLDAATANQMKIFLAQMQFSQADYLGAISVLEPWLKSMDKTLPASAYAMLAAAYYSTENMAVGLPYIEWAITLSKDAKQPWLQMAFSGNYQLKKLDRALSYLDMLILNFPEVPQYWNQKSGVLQMQEKYQQAANVKELAYKRGYLTQESDIISLVQLLASVDIPYKAAQILESALQSEQVKRSEKNLRLLHQAWLQSKEIEKAKTVLQSLFAMTRTADDGLNLLRFQIDAEQWADTLLTAKALSSIEATKEQEGKILLFYGIAYYRDGNIRKALATLGKATAYPAVQAQAKMWVNYVNATTPM